MAYSQAITQDWIPWTLKTTWNWSKRWRKRNFTEWLWSTTFWRYGRAEKNYMLPRKNRVPRSSKWQLLETFQIPKRSWDHPGQIVNILVQLHSNCQKDHHCHPLCLQRTTLEDDLKYKMFAESNESTVIQPEVIEMVHLNAFPAMNIGFAGMVIWIIRTQAMMTGRQRGIRYRAWEWHWGSGKPRAPGCVCHPKCCQIDSANTEFNQTGWTRVDDGHCDGNNEE